MAVENTKSLQAGDESYLTKRIAEAEAEVVKAKTEVEEKGRALKGTATQGNAACQEISQLVNEQAQLLKKALVKEAKAGTWSGSLILKGLPGFGKLVAAILVVWLFFKSHLVVAGAVYCFFVWLARRNNAIAKSKEARTALDAIAKCTPRLMIFGDAESSDSDYPYDAVIFPDVNGSITSSQYRINKEKYGAVFGAKFVGFSRDAVKNQFAVALMFKQGGGNPRVVDFENVSQVTLATWERLLLSIQDKLSKISSPMDAIGSGWFEWANAQQRLKDMERRLTSTKGIEENWRTVALPADKLDQIIKIVDMFASGSRVAAKGLLLWGPPGTGKTAIAKNLAKTSGCSFLSVGSADLKGQHIGQTAPKVQAIWEKAKEQAPCIMFIDECEGIFAKRGSTSTDSFGEELVQAFLANWDGLNESAGKVFVIGATNRRELLDEAVMSRFTRSVEIGLPDAKCREKILQAEFKKAGIAIPEIEGIVRETAGMSGRDLHQVAASVAAESFGDAPTPEQITAEVRRLRGKVSSTVKELSWDDIVLPASVRSEFETLGKELRNAEKLRELNIDPPRGALLWGPPGTGKTQLARVLANESGLAFMAVSTADIKKAYIGHSGQAVRELFEKARSQSPCILFIDEMDIIAPSRNGEASSSKADEEIVGQLLQEMDGAVTRQGGVFVMAASNHPDKLDSAILSRLERRIELPLPDADSRKAICAMLLKNKPLAFDIEDGAQLLADATEGRSGRDLRTIVELASRAAVKRALALSDDVGDLVSIELADLQNAIA